MDVFIYYIWAVVNALLYFGLVEEWNFSRSPATYFICLHTAIFMADVGQSDFVADPELFGLANYIGIGQTCFVFGTIFMKYALAFNPKGEQRKYAALPIIDDFKGVNMYILVFTLLISGAVAAVAIKSTGGVVPLIALYSLMSSSADTAASVYMENRLEISNGKDYLAPGYASQFKDFLFSLCALFFYFKYLIYGGNLRRIFATGLLVLVFIVLISTGGRGNLLLFGATTMSILSSTLIQPYNINRKAVFQIGLGGMVLLSLMTVLMGRGGDGGFKLENILLGGPSQIFERMAMVTAHENIQIYKALLIKTEIQWGSGWVGDILTILPGKQETTGAKLAKVLGWIHGNSGFHVWTSLMYNFGQLGFFFAFIWGCIQQAFFINFIRSKKVLSRLIAQMYTFVLMAFAIDPFGLVLYGFLIISLFWLFLKMIRLLVYSAKPKITASNIITS